MSDKTNLNNPTTNPSPVQRYVARVVRALFIGTLGFGSGAGMFVFIGMLIFTGSPHAFELGWKAGLIIGLIFASMIVAVMLPMDLTAHLNLSKENYNEIWDLEQTREVQADGTTKEIVAACRQALLVVPYVISVSDDTENMVTRAKTSKSWRSTGEEIEVEINPIAANKWCLRCTSKSIGKNVVFDYGKNFENVEAWKTHFSKVISGEASNLSY
jgi:hypothetical protein